MTAGKQVTGGTGSSIWTRIAGRVGSGAATPKLRSSVRQIRFDRNVSLSDRDTGRTFELSEDEVHWVEQFDGTCSVSELIVADLGRRGRFAPAPLLDLLDRLGQADLLDAPNVSLYRKLDERFRGRIADLGATPRFR